MILVNGTEQDSIAVSDRGLQYGDGLFETIAIADGRPRLWHAHMARLADGCRRLALPQPDQRLLADEAARVLGDRQRAVLKLIITRGSGGRGYRQPDNIRPARIMIRHPWPEHADRGHAATLRLCRTPLSCNPALAGIKHLNRLEQVIARSEWNDESIDEGLMCNLQGEMIEGTMSNLFMVREGELLTPALNDCGVAGVMRRTVLELGDALGLPCRQVRLRPDAMSDMQEVFITNAIIGIRPARAFETTEYGDNPLTQRLKQALRERLGRDDG